MDNDFLICPYGEDHLIATMDDFKQHLKRCRLVKGNTAYLCKYYFGHAFSTAQKADDHEQICKYKDSNIIKYPNNKRIIKLGPEYASEIDQEYFPSQITIFNSKSEEVNSLNQKEENAQSSNNNNLSNQNIQSKPQQANKEKIQNQKFDSKALEAIMNTEEYPIDSAQNIPNLENLFINENSNSNSNSNSNGSIKKIYYAGIITNITDILSIKPNNTNKNDENHYQYHHTPLKSIENNHVNNSSNTYNETETIDMSSMLFLLLIDKIPEKPIEMILIPHIMRTKEIEEKSLEIEYYEDFENILTLDENRFTQKEYEKYYLGEFTIRSWDIHIFDTFYDRLGEKIGLNTKYAETNNEVLIVFTKNSRGLSNFLRNKPSRIGIIVMPYTLFTDTIINDINMVYHSHFFSVYDNITPLEQPLSNTNANLDNDFEKVAQMILIKEPDYDKILKEIDKLPLDSLQLKKLSALIEQNISSMETDFTKELATIRKNYDLTQENTKKLREKTKELEYEIDIIKNQTMECILRKENYKSHSIEIVKQHTSEMEEIFKKREMEIKESKKTVELKLKEINEKAELENQAYSLKRKQRDLLKKEEIELSKKVEKKNERKREIRTRKRKVKNTKFIK